MCSARGFTAFAAACAMAVAFATQTTSASAEPAVKYMEVNNARFPYAEEGSGPPVVFVHGAAADYRLWNPQRATLAQEGYRAVSYTLRYFGTEPWDKDGPVFSGKTHAEDLAAFIRGLGAGPVHVVAWSYAGQVVFNVVVQNPELVKSLFIYETSSATHVADPLTLKTVREEGSRTFGSTVKAVKENDKDEAIRQLINGVGGKDDYFASQPATLQALQLDSAPSALRMFNAPPPVPISCSQLGSVVTPMAVAWGAETRPFFRLIAEEAARCTPAGTHITIPGAGHMWPSEQPAKFTATLIDFLKKH